MPLSTTNLIERAAAGERISPADALHLLNHAELAPLARAANTVTRRLHPQSYRTYNIDCNINYTNICTSDCRFCAFSRHAGDDDAYLISREELFEKIRRTIGLGGDQILLQGGLHPGLDIEWYEQFFRDIRENFPRINIHGLSPPEIYHIGRVSGLPTPQVMARLRVAGLGSLPGGGAEILVDLVRQKVSPSKVSADGWLDICRQWHEQGGRGTATMMFGHLETPAERIEHLRRLRDLQDQTSGFTAFICWTFQPGNTDLEGRRKVGAFGYLRMLALSRLFLDNFQNLQASWVTQGLDTGQAALLFGANDMGSLMIEENVVAAAGTKFRIDEPQLRRAITRAGFNPRRRNVFYQLTEPPRENTTATNVS